VVARLGIIEVLGKPKWAIYLGHTLKKEEGNSAIPSSKRQAVRDRGHSPNGQEVLWIPAR